MLKQQTKSESGFSLLELIIAMAITLALAAAACTLLAQSLKIRTRANDKIDGLADAQRALNIMSILLLLSSATMAIARYL